MEDYDPIFSKKIKNIEKKHFWFQSRKKLLLFFIKQFLKTPSNILEVGPGSFDISCDLIKNNISKNLCCCDIFHDILKNAPEKLRKNCIQIDSKNKLPFSKNFDAVLLFDVIEHIKDDLNFLNEIKSCLKKNGLIFISVPSYNFLFSEIDKNSGHKRRYSKTQFTRKLKNNGFKVVYSTYFFSFLLPIIYIRKALKNQDGLKINPIANFFFFLLSKIEFNILKNTTLPFGASLFIIIEKKI